MRLGSLILVFFSTPVSFETCRIIYMFDVKEVIIVKDYFYAPEVLPYNRHLVFALKFLPVTQTEHFEPKL